MEQATPTPVAVSDPRADIRDELAKMIGTTVLQRGDAQTVISLSRVLDYLLTQMNVVTQMVADHEDEQLAKEISQHVRDVQAASLRLIRKPAAV